MPETILIRGKALACSLGRDRRTIRDNLSRRLCPTTRIPLEWAHIPDSRPYYLIAGFPDHRHGHRFYEVLCETVADAIADAGMTQRETEGLAVFFGSTSMDVPLYESAYEKRTDRGGAIMNDACYGYGHIAAVLADRFAITGPCWSFTTACTSSANGLLCASAMLRDGRIDRALVVGYDLFNHLGFYGFESLKLLSPTFYKPFDRDRDGIIMGEGCGVVVLEKRKNTGGCLSLLGGANLCDIHNVTTHDPEGETIRRTIDKAIRAAGIQPEAIRAVKAHATGSENNDRAECAGMRRFFGANLPPVTALKPYVGHTVGAAGVIELILFAEALEEGFIPATPGFREADAELDVIPLTAAREALPGPYLLNYFGFGGNCVSLVLADER